MTRLAIHLAVLLSMASCTQLQAASAARSWHSEREQHLHWRQLLLERQRATDLAEPRPGPAGQHLVIELRGRTLFYADGVFLEYRNGRHVAVRPPSGIIVPELPAGQRVLFDGPHRYHVYGGVLYLWDPARTAFVVSEPPARLRGALSAGESRRWSAGPPPQTR